jgi:hypothetical protein
MKESLMYSFRLAVALVGAIALTGCASTPKVSSDATGRVTFTAYRTFALVNPEQPSGMDPVTYERIRQNVENAVAAKGYAKAVSANLGELSVILTFDARERLNFHRWGPAAFDVHVHQYTEGKLAVDVFDARTRQSLWHGQATQTIDPDKPDPAAINAAVASVMATFPARS